MFLTLLRLLLTSVRRGETVLLLFIFSCGTWRMKSVWLSFVRGSLSHERCSPPLPPPPPAITLLLVLPPRTHELTLPGRLPGPWDVEKEEEEEKEEGGGSHQVHDVTADQWPASSPGCWTCWTRHRDARTEGLSGYMQSDIATQSDRRTNGWPPRGGTEGGVGGRGRGGVTGTPTMDTQVRSHPSHQT